MGAWIETWVMRYRLTSLEVAPHVGAWIETATDYALDAYNASHPMWVRGLKLLLRYEQRNLTKSHPMWVRGLKLLICAPTQE